MKTLLLMSGGLDSTTLLYSLLNRNHDVECMAFDYGQTHIKELLRAAEICEDLGVKLHRCRLPSIFTDCCLVGSKPIPHGQHESNIVPNRNMVFLSAATAYAVQHSHFDAVAYGANLDDAEGGFPDCSKLFIQAMRDAMRFCHTKPIQLLAPFISTNMTKKDVAAMAYKLGVPIMRTWSCYKGGEKPCGTCGACQLRNKALCR